MAQQAVETDQPRRKRTMILVVLGVLIALTVLLGVVAFFIKSLNGNPDTPTMAEVRKMAAAVGAFQSQYKVSYIPSRIKLCKFACQYDKTNQLDIDSFAYLNQVWPRLHWSRQEPDTRQIAYLRIDWDGIEGPGPERLVLKEGDPPPTDPAPVILEGDQCLVFFLGGIPESQDGKEGGTGFAINPMNPAAPKGERITPFYEFRSNRLVRLHGNAFFSCLDPYGKQPYAYFSAYGRRNGYNRYEATLGNSDCALLGVWPYALSLGPPPKYVNPDSFQIISAGADTRFGPGTALPKGRIWSPAKAKEIDPAGRDDRSNFHTLRLGTPSQ